MKLYKLLTIALTVFAAFAFATITTFAEEEVAAACAESAASIGFIPVAVAALVIPTAFIAIRRTRRAAK